MSDTVSLKEHFEKILAEKDKAINIALAAAKEAVEIAEINSEKWRANANEWRGAMSDREKNFASRSELEVLQKIVWIGMGFVLAIQFLLKFLIK